MAEIKTSLFNEGCLELKFDNRKPVRELSDCRNTLISKEYIPLDRKISLMAVVL